MGAFAVVLWMVGRLPIILVYKHTLKVVKSGMNQKLIELKRVNIPVINTQFFSFGFGQVNRSTYN